MNFNLRCDYLHSLVLVSTEGASKPFLLSIGERADRIAQAYEDRQMTTQQTLTEVEELAAECVNADAERRQLNLDENTFAIYTTLNLIVSDLSVQQAQDINNLFARFPDYQWNEQQKSRLRTELYRMMRPIVGADKLIGVTNTLIKLQRV